MSVTPYGFISPRVNYVAKPVTGNVVPRRAISLVPDDMVIYKGFPRAPRSGVKAQFLVSGTGMVLSDRDGMGDINEDTWASFIVDELFWDAVTGIWQPIRKSSPVIYQIEATAGMAPLYNTVEYRNGKELFLIDSLTLDDETLHTNFNQGNDDTIAFTLGIAFTPIAAGPSDLVVFADGTRIGITPTGLEATMDGHSWSVPIPLGPLKISPMYLIFSVTQTKATLYAGYSPTLFYQGSATIARQVTRLDFSISSPMHLFSVDVWAPESPTLTEIVARYSSVLGSNTTPIGSFV